VTGAQTPAASFRVTNLPPGLVVTGGDVTGLLNASSGTITGVPTSAGTFTARIVAYEKVDAKGDAFGPTNVTFSIAAGTPAAPTFAQQPVSQSVTAGSNVSFFTTVTGSPAPTFQWRRNGANIVGGTATFLTLNNVQPADAGEYALVATNSVGSTTSAAATLTVIGGSSLPVFTAEPVSQTIASGGTVVFSARATGLPTPTFQWRRNSAPIGGATNTMLVLTGADAVPGNYSVVASNAAGSTASAAATLATSTSANFGHLINLSILTALESADATFTLGFVVGGGGPGISKSLLVRAAGPSLEPLGVAHVNADPKLELFSGATTRGANDNWGGGAVLSAAFNEVGAFAYVAATSKDAAMLGNFAAGDNSVKVSGVTGATGTVIAELYDTIAATSAGVPRLINVSVLKPIESGATLTAGFVIGGASSRTVLVRAIGPSLAAFGVSGAMSDPQLKLFDGTQTKIAENDNWGGDIQLGAAAAAVSAFTLPDPTSKDAVLLLTLAPGNYTAQVSGVGSAAGSALVEVYEVP
jgi:hypothetical protein